LELRASSLLHSSDETGSDLGSNGEELERPQLKESLTDDGLLHNDKDILFVPSDSSVPCVPETVLSEYQSALFDKVVFYMEKIDDQAERVYLPPMRGSQMAVVTSVIKEMNIVLCRAHISSLMDLCNVVYCTARVNAHHKNFFIFDVV